MEEAALPFSPKRQSAFIGHLFDPATLMFKHVNGIMSEQWFGNPTHQKIWQFFVLMHKKLGRIPTDEEIKGSSELEVVDKQLKKAICSGIDEALQDRKIVGHDILRLEIEEWMHAKILQDAIERGAKLFNGRKFKEAQEILSDSIKKFNRSRAVLSDDDPEDILGSISLGLGPQNVVPFGIPAMDNFLFPDNPKGSLCKGDQTVIMAPINNGKTTTMTTVTIHNARAGNFTLFMAHEGNQHSLRLKFVRGFLTLIDRGQMAKIFPGVPPEKFDADIVRLRALAAKSTVEILKEFATEKTTKFGVILQHITNYVFKMIRFIPYIKPGVCVEELTPIIERAQDNCKDKNSGRGFDLFVCDYPGILNTKTGSKGNYQQRQIKQEVYEYYAALAGQHDWHSMVAIQTNREGSKINAGIGARGVRSEYAERLLGNEDVSEVWGALMGAATVITVNRSPADQKLNRVTYSVTKSRSSETMFNVTCFSKFGQSISHAPEFGCMGFSGTTANEAVAKMYLKEGQSYTVTQAEMIAAQHYNERLSDEILAQENKTVATELPLDAAGRPS